MHQRVARQVKQRLQVRNVCRFRRQKQHGPVVFLRPAEQLNALAPRQARVEYRQHTRRILPVLIEGERVVHRIRHKAAETGLHQRLGEHLPAFGVRLKHHYALRTRLCSLRHRKSPRYCVESAALIT